MQGRVRRRGPSVLEHMRVHVALRRYVMDAMVPTRWGLFDSRGRVDSDMFESIMRVARMAGKEMWRRRRCFPEDCLAQVLLYAFAGRESPRFSDFGELALSVPMGLACKGCCARWHRGGGFRGR